MGASALLTLLANSKSLKLTVCSHNLRNARLVDCYASYFGAITCVAWSPDGRYIIVSKINLVPSQNL